DERFVIVTGIAVRRPVGAEDRRTDADFQRLLHAAIGADAAVLPDAGHLLELRRGDGRDLLATGTHQRIEQFNAVNAVVEQVGMSVRRYGTAVDVDAGDLADFRIVEQFGVARREATGTGADHRCAVLFRITVDRQHVGKTGRGRL